jgi:hypothetical protein
MRILSYLIDTHRTSHDYETIKILQGWRHFSRGQFYDFKRNILLPQEILYRSRAFCDDIFDN